MKRVALLYFHQLDFGGVERHLLALFRLGSQAGYEFILFAKYTRRFSDQAKLAGVRIIPWRESWHPLNPLSAFALARTLQENKIQLIHCHDALSSVPGRIASWITGIPVVATVHLQTKMYHGNRQTFAAKMGRKFYLWLDKSLNWLRTDQLIYVSQQNMLEDTLARHAPGEKSCVIHNGIDLSDYQRDIDRAAVRRKAGETENAPVVVFTGRLVEQKGVEVLLDAAAQVVVQHPHLRIWIIGDGPLRPQLEEQAARQQLQSHVRFLGHQENVREFLGAADIFVLPSFYETMSFSLIEAMAAGLACIVTPVGDNGMVIDAARAGKVIPVGDASRLAGAISELLDHPKQKEELGSNARKAAEEFREEWMVSKITDVYHTIEQRKMAGW